MRWPTPLDELGAVDLYLGSEMGVWWQHDGELAARERIDRPELRAAFCQRGVLRQLEPDALPPNR